PPDVFLNFFSRKIREASNYPFSCQVKPGPHGRSRRVPRETPHSEFKEDNRLGVLSTFSIPDRDMHSSLPIWQLECLPQIHMLDTRKKPFLRMPAIVPEHFREVC